MVKVTAFYDWSPSCRGLAPRRVWVFSEGSRGLRVRVPSGMLFWFLIFVTLNAFALLLFFLLKMHGPV